jgi:putative ribosome biogenesis GTPase RsgA
MDQEEECLPRKCEHLTSNPSTTKKEIKNRSLKYQKMEFYGFLNLIVSRF